MEFLTDDVLFTILLRCVYGRCFPTVLSSGSVSLLCLQVFTYCCDPLLTVVVRVRADASMRFTQLSVMALVLMALLFNWFLRVGLMCALHRLLVEHTSISCSGSWAWRGLSWGLCGDSPPALLICRT